jgi:hypothetical protein
MTETEQTLTCFFHPKRETQLRCNRCNKPICIQCATHTPTGYRCPDCIRSQQKIFVTTKWYDPVLAAVITGTISFLGSLIGSYLGFYSVLVAMGAGYLSVLGTKKAISNRRSPILKYVMSGTALIATLAPLLFDLYRYYQLYGFLFLGGLYLFIWRLAFTVIVTAYIYYQLRN